MPSAAPTQYQAPPPSNEHAQRQRQQHAVRHHNENRSSSSGGSNAMPDRVGNYTIREEIGRGSFAVVYRGDKVSVSPPIPVAIKAVIRSKLTTKLLENLESEIRLLKGIKQRNVVELLDCLKTEQHIYLVMAYCSAGDLSQFIRKRGQVSGMNPTLLANGKEKFPHPKEGGLNATVVRCFLGQLAEALKFLRDQNIIHRDIKPQNLLLHPPSHSDVKAGHPDLSIPLLRVADFGFARALPQQSLAETLCGSPLYMAPEILRYEKYDAKADLWSVGAVTFEMCVGKPPFRAQNHVELLRRIERGEDKIVFPDEKPPSTDPGKAGQPTSVTEVAPDIKELIRRLLKRNPVERMSFNDFFKMTDEVVNKWGEESLCAPGSIEQLRPAPPIPQQLQRNSSVPSRRGSGTSTPAGAPITRVSSGMGQPRAIAPLTSTPVPQGHHQQQAPGPISRPSSRPPSVTPSRNPSQPNLTSFAQTLGPIQAQQQAPYTPLIPPSTEAEQEPAFTPLSHHRSQASTPQPSNEPSLISHQTQPTMSNRASPIPRPSSVTADATSLPATETDTNSTQPPSSLTRKRSTFAPKYVVGGGTGGVRTSASGSGENTNVDIKTRDFAALNANVVPPTPPLVSHERGGSRDDIETAGLRAGSPYQTGNKSNLSLALPPGTSTTRQQELMSQSRAGSNGDSDSFLGKEYVVVEKTTVEVNALADELAAQPRRSNTLSRRGSRGFLARQLSGMHASPPPGAGNVSALANASPPSPAAPYPPSSAQSPGANGDQPAFIANPIRPGLPTSGSSPRSRSSFGAGNPVPYVYGGVYGSSPGRALTVSNANPNVPSPLAIVGNSSAAIAKALNMASLKLFGSPTENIWLRKRAYRRPVERFNPDLSDPEEEKLLTNLEDIALKATVIFDFADTKFFLMTTAAGNVGPTPTSTTALNSHQNHMNASQASPFFSSVYQTPLSPPKSRRASSSSSSSERALVTSPQLQQNKSLKSGLDQKKVEALPAEALVLYLKALAFLQKGIEMFKIFWSTKTAGQTASSDLNDYVQWLRSRFNECYEKADFSKTRLVGDIPDSAMLAEKLIFDRALEMSRAAAVSELMNENSSECEIAYDTALWMLYAILDETMQEGEIVEEEDKVTVQKFIQSIQGRLDALRSKMRTSSGS